ncbi:hypothetical protein C2G38_2168637 [Gigaspora rosea]|uniref:Uncharacterized protein n=1 Tax=Gigaspora rosea TaxID=44941 RepID=A0A397VZI4_9GLOM|nr:hypothetical protein C2G38_2168637 [Gigaspora rosea]
MYEGLLMTINSIEIHEESRNRYLTEQHKSNQTKPTIILNNIWQVDKFRRLLTLFWNRSILKDYVTVINVGESPDTKVFLAYSAVLRYRFLHLRNEWSNVSKDKNYIKTLYLKKERTFLSNILKLSSDIPTEE